MGRVRTSLGKHCRYDCVRTLNLTIDGTPGNLALSLAVLALLLAEVIPCGFLKGTSPTTDAALAR